MRSLCLLVAAVVLSCAAHGGEKDKKDTDPPVKKNDDKKTDKPKNGADGFETTSRISGYYPSIETWKSRHRRSRNDLAS